ncbi:MULTISPECIES: ParA family protein [Vibrio]|uniref:ParA family protein n=1 Tax=Vibrio parahaemolyticus TaxID=670 RepID=A0AA47JNB1_VIBPH|nr:MULTISPECIES: ParA family protein [Vibrio]MBE3780053.1 ParA family protein [Vibrio parahaemolyticus]MBE4231385.1 ParA family protein [Vibrio parahaemolyticus]MCZ6249639.1 ParA family protein [Vibrio parahaemolyticus]MCZ6279382.1 ParA family protein [Vibrio parahaemolyticus]MCZ6417416.1 ParA family protein [Vibrio parahaemolyticus]
MPVIVFASSKGGAGKTTACRLLTGEFARQGLPKNIGVTLIDADPNQHAAKWALMDGTLPNINLVQQSNEESILEDIDAAQENSAFVLVDLEGVASMTVAHAISRADLVILMTQPSEDDEDELIKTVKLVRRQEKALRRSIPHAVMITRTNAAFYTKMHKAILNDMEANCVDVFNVSLIERAAFKAIRTYGGIVHNLDRKEVAGVDKAALNVEEFAEEVKKKLKANMIK